MKNKTIMIEALESQKKLPPPDNQYLIEAGQKAAAKDILQAEILAKEGVAQLEELDNQIQRRRLLVPETVH